MITLKDIKVSKNRIPVQNAIWLRPTGGMSFKIYYPHGGDWSEINFNGDSPSPDPTPTPTPTPDKKSVSYISKRENKIIVGRCIPLKARPGSLYFFADGRPKFKGNKVPYTDGQRHSESGRWIYTYGYNGNNELIWDKFYRVVPLLRKDNWNPVLIHIRSENYYNNNRNDCEVIVIDGVKIYFTRAAAGNITCDTASPFFKIIDGHLRNVAKPRMPIIRPNEGWGEHEAKHFVTRRLTYRGSRVRGTQKWNYGYTPLPATVPISLKREWRLCRNSEFARRDGPHSWRDDLSKTYLIQQIRKNRKSVDKVIIRRFSTSKYGGQGGRYNEFREIKFLK